MAVNDGKKIKCLENQSYWNSVQTNLLATICFGWGHKGLQTWAGKKLNICHNPFCAAEMV